GVPTAGGVGAAPEVPTIAEAGVPGYDTSSWFAFFVPAKTPAEIIFKMHADTVAALAEPQIRAKLDTLGVVVVGFTPEQLGMHLEAEMGRWAPVIKAANIRVSEGSPAATRERAHRSNEKWDGRTAGTTKPMTTTTLGTASFLIFAGMVHAEEIRVLSTQATEEAYRELVPQFEKASGHKVTTVFTGTLDANKRLAAGET